MISFFIGLIVGGISGLMVSSLLFASSDTLYQENRQLRNKLKRLKGGE